jgi:PAS domain S-box-containing protein
MSEFGSNRVQPSHAGLSPETWRQICEQSGMALVVADTELCILEWNRAAQRMFGAAAGQMVGTQLLSVFPAHRRAVVEPMIRRSLEGESTAEFEITDRDEAGERRHLAVTASPAIGADGQVLGLCVWLRDISHCGTLLERVGHDRKMAALGELAGSLAHHFNNILGGIVTSVDFALASNDSAIERSVLAKTNQALTRATSLMENLLAFAEGDHRRDDLCDLTEILLSTLNLLESEIARAKVSLELDLATVATTAVPRRRMMTVIRNLVKNALDAMREGGRLSVFLEPHGDRIVLRFKDTGCGVASDELDKVFEPFFSTKIGDQDRDEQPIGLGLAVAHGIVNDIGGTIEFHSSPGQGTEVEIRLPHKVA